MPADHSFIILEPWNEPNMTNNCNNQKVFDHHLWVKEVAVAAGFTGKWSVGGWMSTARVIYAGELMPVNKAFVKAGFIVQKHLARKEDINDISNFRPDGKMLVSTDGMSGDDGVFVDKLTQAQVEYITSRCAEYGFNKIDFFTRHKDDKKWEPPIEYWTWIRDAINKYFPG